MNGKPAPWYLNAARRTLIATLPALARPDDAWAAARLEGGERELFMRLPPQERAHGIEVARRLLATTPDARPQLVRAALLHDVGKLGTPQFVLWRVLTHLLPEAELPAEPRLGGLQGARQARRHHAAYGAALILQAGGSEEVARLVARHHDDEGAPAHGGAVGGHQRGEERAEGELARLRAADERT